jgi:Flp pilus assembly pilin Flp
MIPRWGGERATIADAVDAPPSTRAASAITRASRRVRAGLRRRNRGQGMTEYIVVVALVAIASAGVYNLLGKTVRNQTAAVANGLAGKEGAAKEAIAAAEKSSQDAKADANNTRGLSTFTDSTGLK